METHVDIYEPGGEAVAKPGRIVAWVVGLLTLIFFSVIFYGGGVFIMSAVPLVGAFALLVAAPLPWVAMILVGVPFQRKAEALLHRIKVSQGEQHNLNSENKADGTTARGRQSASSSQTLVACAVSIIVLFISGAVVYGAAGMAFAALPKSIEVLGAIIFTVAAPIPWVLALMAGKPFMRPVVEPKHNIVQVDSGETGQLKGELLRSETWVKREQTSKRNAVITAGLITYAVMVVGTLVIYGLLAIFIPSFRKPSPGLILLFIPPVVGLPPFIPLFLGIWLALPFRRKVKDGSGPLFMG